MIRVPVDLTGIDQGVLCRYRKGDPAQRITLDTVRRIRIGLDALEAVPVAA